MNLKSEVLTVYSHLMITFCDIYEKLTDLLHVLYYNIV
jgi:hypothetical protein